MCNGKRFWRSFRSYLHKEKKRFHDILEMSVDEAVVSLVIRWKKAKGKNRPMVQMFTKKNSAFKRVGLGYVKLGQSSNTNSGG
jgi:excinuclease UvrABC ATPase subunit